MKKMTMIIMAFTMIAGLFAYEPKKECAKVKRNGNVVYYENTELYDWYGGKPDPKARGWDGWKTSHDYVKWAIYKGYTVEKLVDYEYERLESLIDSYLFSVKQIMKPDVSNADIAFTDFFNKINGTNETPKDRNVKIWLQNAKYAKRTAIVSIPFVTEENFLYMTKTDMLVKMKAFIEEVEANNQ